MKDQLNAATRRGARRIIGLMSGTSADGVDAALLEVSGWGDTTSWELLAFHTKPYPPEVRREILALQEGDAPHLLERLARLHFGLGDIYAESCRAVAQMAGVALSEVDLVGLHGQTVFHGTAHDAGSPATLQLGEAAVLAERTGLSVVSNFRARDVAAGGTGAPLVPYVDYLLFRSDDEARLCLNLGGIANITALPRGAEVGDVVAFDTGPGNMVLDALVERFTEGRETFDRNGDRSAQGRPDPGLLEELMAHEFIARRPPKSAGREEFGAAFVARLIGRAEARKLSPAATLATAAAFTARSVAEAYRLHVLPGVTVKAVLVSGGGVHNRTLVEMLAKEMAPATVRSTAHYGLDPDAKEAVAFALLANESVHGRAGNLPLVTGASHPVVLGAFVPGRGA